MEILQKILIGIIAFEHVYILWLEMFAWETAGKKAFKGVLPDEMFKSTKAMAANQGLYNGFLAAGLIWSLFIENAQWSFYVSIFFLTCVFIAGIYGGLTASRKILFIQAMPAMITLILLHF